MDVFEEAYERLYLYAFRAAVRVLGDKEAARDVASETVARAYSRWGQIASYGEAWVTRVAVNLALDGLRRRPARLTPVSVVAEPSLDRVILVGELARLPRRQREGLVLRYLFDLDERATAEVLGVSVGTVKTHVSRALNRIRKQFPAELTLGMEPQ
jgi:RNA polymerase sigma factor (sigma-70 family)